MAAYKKYANDRIKASPKLTKHSKVSMPKFSDYDYSRHFKNPKEKIVDFRNIGEYMKLRSQGYTTLWSGEGKIAMVKKRPAARRGSFTKRARATRPNEEGSMVYSLTRRPRRKSARRARRNPWVVKGASRTYHAPKRRRKHAKRHKAIRLGAHRPLLVRSHSGWRRPKRSRLFPRATRINPRRRSHRRYRRNPLGLPKLPFNLQNVAMGGLKIAGGIAIGMMGMPLIVKHLAPMVDKTGQYRKFYGLVHVVLGAVAASMIKKQIVKEMALTVAGVGVYDLLSQNLTMLGLPQLMGDEPGVIGVDMEPAKMGSSYQSALGASYGADDIAYGGDNDSYDC